MDDTVCKKCPWVKSGFCSNVEECPNYIETWWKQGQTGNPKLVRDCIPKRLMIQMCNIQERFEGVQAASEQARNECHAMKGHFQALVYASKKVLEEHQENIEKTDSNEVTFREG